MKITILAFNDSTHQDGLKIATSLQRFHQEEFLC